MTMESNTTAIEVRSSIDKDVDKDDKTRAKRTHKSAAPKAKASDATKKVPASGATKGDTFTTVDIATERDISPKTLRARIRRNIECWEPLFKDGKRHVFADNVTTRKAVAALLEA